MTRWSKKFDRCTSCQKTDLPHKGNGLCCTCYAKMKWKTDCHKILRQRKTNGVTRQPKPRPGQPFYRGPIHAGDRFTLDKDAFRGAFVWGRKGDCIELRSYGQDESPTIKIVPEVTLRATYNRTVPNPVGTLVSASLDKDVKA